VIVINANTNTKSLINDSAFAMHAQHTLCVPSVTSLELVFLGIELPCASFDRTDLLPTDCKNPVLWWVLRANVSTNHPTRAHTNKLYNHYVEKKTACSQSNVIQVQDLYFKLLSN